MNHRRFTVCTIEPPPKWWIDRFNEHQDFIRLRVRDMLARGPLTGAQIRYVLHEYTPEEVDYAVASMVLDKAALTEDGRVYQLERQVRT